jgi:hypothetical protein
VLNIVLALFPIKKGFICGTGFRRVQCAGEGADAGD